MSRGRHARPSRAAKVAGTTAVAGAAAAVATVGLPGHASAAIIIPVHTAAPAVQAVHTVDQVNRHVVKHRPAYTVRNGDYLSKIASAECHNPADWTGVYLRNKKLIGSDPDLILPGQHLILDCRQGKVWEPTQVVVVQPQASSQSAGQSQPPSTTVEHHLTYQGGDPSGQLTRDEVGTLWLDAGGPAWAEWSAEQVSYCESGWNTNAYNPSGASGLWQILGEVVPGNVFDARVNAANAVAKFTASGDTWAQWVCQP